MIHYHGTPITPRSDLHRLAGRSFCVSFAHPADLEVCHEIGENVMLDNGAFSIWRRGISVDWYSYHTWVAPWLMYYTTWAVIPDVIGGTEAENDALIDEWPHGDKGAPVWHTNESIERLNRLAATWSRVCIGSSAEHPPNSPQWHHKMISVFNSITDENGMPPCWIHMLRGLQFAGSQYPFASVDSTNVARNSHGKGHTPTISDPVHIAQVWDARQCPATWANPGEQQCINFE